MTTTKLSSLTVIALVLLAVGCAQNPDPRSADVVVTDPSLLPATIKALAWWNEATDNDTADAQVTDHCSGNGRACIVIGRDAEPLPDGDDGLTDIHADQNGRMSKIRIDPSAPQARVFEIIAHELGHAFEMPDLSNAPSDLMRAVGTGGQLCISSVTLSHWSDEYGVNGTEVCRDLSEEK